MMFYGIFNSLVLFPKVFDSPTIWCSNFTYEQGSIIIKKNVLFLYFTHSTNLDAFLIVMANFDHPDISIKTLFNQRRKIIALL